ncbi:MAG: DNA recombination protein RmuC [Oscillospiraceae bacterium]|nr:DNA recombination protein RmuC [Oscillospiraceae bacterium]
MGVWGVVTMVLSGVGAALSLAAVWLLLRRNGLGPEREAEHWRALRQELQQELRAVRQETGETVRGSVSALGETLAGAQSRAAEAQDRRLAELREHLTHSQDQLRVSVGERLTALDGRLQGMSAQNEQKLEAMRQTMEARLRHIQEEGGKQLEQIRATVDEKLQKTLEERIGQSFALVSTRLEEVYKGLGEMQQLAAGVGDLKRVLSNVKTRGMLGELQLGAILEQILAPEQYETNVATRPGSREVVEYAVRLPGDGDRPVYLPIDAKFPGDTFEALMRAYEAGVAEEVEAAAAALERVLKQMARDIQTKYVSPPHTTDFAVMFLPVEGLYAEAVRRGMVETLQRDFHVNIAGPTTMAALLNSLQMGFKTLAIQKRSSEVWDVLSSVKTEFSKFAGVLQNAQRKLDQARGDLDALVGTRTRAIERKLRDVAVLPESASAEAAAPPPEAED